MKHIMYLTCIACLLMLVVGVAGASEDARTGLIPVTLGNSSNHHAPPPFGNVPGGSIDDKVYLSLAPCYMDHAIKTYGPVPVFTVDHAIVSKRILANYSPAERDALYQKLDKIYASTRASFTKDYGYPNGPVISFGYDALGSMVVGINEKSSVDSKTLDEMYSRIADASKNESLNPVPVLFYAEPMPKLDLGRSDVWRPVIGGGSPRGRFTSGFASTLGGQTGFVTAGHVGGVGTTIYQPDLNYPIGTLTISSGGASSDSSWVSYSNNAGQIFESSSSQPWVYGWSDPSVGLSISMSGISSGVSSGTVIQKLSVYNSYFGKMIDNPWAANYASTSGDSGAPVYYKDASQHIQLSGVHWGQTRYSIFSPITNVLNDL